MGIIDALKITSSVPYISVQRDLRVVTRYQGIYRGMWYLVPSELFPSSVIWVSQPWMRLIHPSLFFDDVNAGSGSRPRPPPADASVEHVKLAAEDQPSQPLVQKRCGVG